MVSENIDTFNIATLQMQEDIEREELKMDPVSPMEFMYERISVDAEIEREVEDASGKYHKQKAIRKILKTCSGKFAVGTMTAILGPSGSGKTTLLNLLSGRLLSKNLDVRGKIIVNGEEVSNVGKFKSLIGYVMQEDLLMATFSPRETFKFVADLRLPEKTQEQKNDLVDNIIAVLGLNKCADTYVGNNLIRGISGGEKKRTSIGAELLINPSLIFLDQPTTGLDSTTALHVIRFLNKLSLKGRTIVTTIHQPSSQIFREFNRILLMLDGNIVYHGEAEASMAYFERLGFSVPLHSNPMDYYMKLMNKQGIQMRYIEEQKSYTSGKIEEEFEERVTDLVKQYKLGEVRPTCDCHEKLEDTKKLAPWGAQLCINLKRNFLNIMRNPLAIRAQLFQNIFFGVLTIILYERKASGLDEYIQNTSGLLNFITMNIVFAAVFSTLNVFSSERSVFIRERLSNTYSASSYFTARILAYVPLDIIFPFIMVVICYFVVNLDNDGDNFLRTAIGVWLGAFMSSAYGFIISALFADPEVAMALVPVLIIPFLLLGGFFAPLENVHDFFRWIQYLSMFKYTYQSLLYAQFFDDEQGFTITLMDQSTVTYQGNILGENGALYVEEPYWLGLMLMAIIGVLMRFLAFLALYFLSNPKRLNLNPLLENSQKNTSNKNSKNINKEIKFHTQQQIKQENQEKVDSSQNFNDRFKPIKNMNALS